MPRVERKRITVTDIPEKLRKKLNSDIGRRKYSSLNDLIATVLSERYGLEHTRARRPARTVVEDRIIFKPTVDLYEAIRQHAFDARATMAGIVVFGLMQHYKLDPHTPGRNR
jgi:hypothetical protein